MFFLCIGLDGPDLCTVCLEKADFGESTEIPGCSTNQSARQGNKEEPLFL